MAHSREKLEAQLDDFDPDRRQSALRELIGLADAGLIELPAPTGAVNLHCHTFFSYNGYGYSPTRFAWQARCAGLSVAGIVDFDVLDAVDEFLAACRALDLKGCAGVETRIFLPEYGTCEVNSPGEPGIAYYMAEGFTTGSVKDAALLEQMRQLARNRTLNILERVNPYLDPVTIDFDRDVAPRTPAGNATERHLCEAYEAKAVERFPVTSARARFWADRLDEPPETVAALFEAPPAFQGLIRAKTMKRGGVGYAAPEPSSFPTLDQMTAFASANGAIPTYTWLDGTSGAEQDIDVFLDRQMAVGTRAINIIPDRKWNVADPQTKAIKVANLNTVVEAAQRRGLPIIVGTEMNAPGQRFVDAFDAPELASHAPVFRKGAYIVYAHTLLEAEHRMGYLSEWAASHFVSVAEKNAFYARVGAATPPSGGRISAVSSGMAPADVLDVLGI